MRYILLFSCLLALINAGCDTLADDLENPQEHLEIESKAALVGTAPQLIEVTVDVTNTHRRRNVTLTHDGCPIKITGLIPENESEVVWEPDYVCIQPLITSRIDSKATKTFKFAVRMYEPVMAGVTPGNYQVQVSTFFNETENEVFSAGTVALSDAVEVVPTIREIDGIRFETTTSKTAEETGYLTDLTITNLQTQSVTISQYGPDACPFYLTGFVSQDALNAYFLPQDKWDPWEQLVNQKCLITFEPITLAPTTSETLTSFIANPRQASITLPQHLLAMVTVRIGEDQVSHSFLMAAGVAQ